MYDPMTDNLCRMVTYMLDHCEIPTVFLSRSNLDPFNQYTEDQIWDALERTHMKECVSKAQREHFAGNLGAGGECSDTCVQPGLLLYFQDVCEIL